MTLYRQLIIYIGHFSVGVPILTDARDFHA